MSGESWIKTTDRSLTGASGMGDFMFHKVAEIMTH
jgi:hypothetical protein